MEQASALPERVRKVLKNWRVVPFVENKKKPYVKWKQYQERAPTPGELEKWAKDFPDCMWAVLTGQTSGLIVLDFDVKDGGMKTLAALELTPYTVTPSGGAHVYVRAPEYAVVGGARLEPDQFPGMDLRADGQVALFAGTRSDGGTYEKHENAKLYRVDELPDELQQFIVRRRRGAERKPAPVPMDFKDYADQTELVKEALDLIASGGSRNGAGFHLACQLRDERVEVDAAVVVMEKFADAVPQDGHMYTRQEAYNSLVSAYDSPAREPRALAKYKHSDGHPFTDYGNAERLVGQHGDDFRYDVSAGHWLVWDGQRFRRDEVGAIEVRAKDTVRQILRDAADLESPDDRSKMIAWNKQSEAASKLGAMVNLARTEPGVPVTAADLDSDQWLMNVQNGTVDLRTGTLREPHHRADLMTKLADVPYVPDTTAPRWRKFLREVLPDDDVCAFVQRAVGYSLTGSMDEQVAFLLYGTGRNGKSTFLEILRMVLGDYAQQAPSDLLLQKRSGGVPSDVARLQGARFVTMVETDEGRTLDESTFKQLTGGDRMTARFMYRDWFEFDSVAKLWLATNHRPEVKSNTEAMWRRILLVPFTVRVKRVNKNLKHELAAESAGILAWAVEGAAAWRTEGLLPPAAVTLATDEYRAEMDVLGEFIEDCCVVGAEEQVPSDAIFSRYEEWAYRQNIRVPMTHNKFSRALSERGYERKKKMKMGTKRVRGFVGVGLQPLRAAVRPVP